MNYLQLCQRAADESGTGAFPGTVSGLTGRPKLIRNMVAQAWHDIQTDQGRWKWMEDQFTGTLLSGVSSYEGSDFSLSRFGEWMPGNDPESGVENFTVQGVSEARAKEAGIRYISWQRFWRTYDRGSNADRTGRTEVYSVDGQRQLRVWPTPDQSYTIRGAYRKSPQDLTNGSDTPEMPDEYHMAIVYRALVKLSNHDEAFDQVAMWNTEYINILSDMHRTELPIVMTAGALA